MHNIANLFLFWNNTLHVSDRLSVHHQESKTVYTALGICHTGSVAAWSIRHIPDAVCTVLDS